MLTSHTFKSSLVGEFHIDSPNRVNSNFLVKCSEKPINNRKWGAVFTSAIYHSKKRRRKWQHVGK